MNVFNICQTFCPETTPHFIGEKIGDGADGEVFNFIDNKVIKFSIIYQYDLDIHHIYSNIEKILLYLQSFQPSTHARVYEYKYLGTCARKTVNGFQPYIFYYYVMEKLNKLSEDEKKIFHTILSHEDKNIIKDYSSKKIKEMLKGLSRGLDFDEKKVTFFCNNFRKTMVQHNDIHVRNIMKDALGNFKLIDFDRCEMENNNV